MSAKIFLKPTILKIMIFLSIGILFLYFASESACGISLFFAFCYKAYGFPLAYLVSGDISDSIGHIKTLPFGQYFYKSGNLLLNPAALLIDALLVYLLACFLGTLFRMRVKKFHSE